ncbi:uncharacterized protein LOC126298009 [Schistocerca gregaria]|uniref:uncharacterized protein LOC126298009 n=1 Tax=Schistocerca gregaria TaxID=7010 RepID=UPI00211E8375|nr:uncharacterized protein LOC126298009 [Schistocerca gregaria]
MSTSVYSPKINVIPPINGKTMLLYHITPEEVHMAISKITIIITHTFKNNQKNNVSQIARVLVNEQNGFRKGKSTQIALFNFLKLLYKAIGDKELVCGLFLDVSKAFDLISHKLLLPQLYSYGVHGVFYQ